MNKIKVLVVDDSFFMRKMITDMLQKSGIIEVVSTAKNGLEAIDKISLTKPDIITLDVEMPKMNGLEALKKIMQDTPLPVIMLSSLTKQGTDITIKALELGAFDFVAKPSGTISFDINKVKTELTDKILIANKQKEKWIKQWNYNNIETEKINKTDYQNYQEYNKDSILKGIVAIGTSTGGPKALQNVLTKIPKNFPYAILIVQHMPAGFTKSLAKRLDDLSDIIVVEATDDQIIESGTAYIAPGNYHMTLKNNSDNYRISLNQNDPLAGHRPSVDVLFESFNKIDLNIVFVIMTGMGRDGTKGVSKAKKENDILIVEDEITCVVYGMPKAAVNSGLTDMSVPLHHISDYIIKAVEKQRGWQLWK